MAESTTWPWPDVAATPAPLSESLEERLQRLEGTVAALQDTHALEDRLVERVSARLESTVTSEVEKMAAVDQATSRGPPSTLPPATLLRGGATPVGSKFAPRCPGS